MEDTLTNLLHRMRGDWLAVAIELVLIGLCVNWLASVLHQTRGTRPLRGVLAILVATTVVVRVFGWERLELLYGYVLLGLAFIGLVVFQPELRRAVIRAGDVPFHRRRASQSQLVTALVKAAGFLSRNRYGALVAIQRDVDLTGWAEKGTLINAEVSANLLNTIFFPNSPLHDLGVIVRGTRVIAANCQFPSTESDEVDAALGSRHLAAIGMSYETDALVLVVSEESGVISLADNGKLTRFLTLDDLAAELETRLSHQRAPERSASPAKRLTSLSWQWVRRAIVVIPLTGAIWYLADQATLVDASVEIELNIRHDNPAYVVDIVEPRSNVVDLADPRAVVLTARVRGPRHAIEQLRVDAGDRPYRMNWVLPEDYSRSGQYELFPEQLRSIIESLRELRTRGLSVQQVPVKDKVRLSIDELVALPVPVQVSNEPVPVEVERIDPATVEVRVRSRDVPDLPVEGQRAVRAPLGEERLKGLEPGAEQTFERVPLAQRIGTVRLVRVNPERVLVAVRVVSGQHRMINNVVVYPFVSPEVAAKYDVQKVDANEWRIDVELAGKEAVLRGLGPGDIQAFVHITGEILPTGDQPPPREMLRSLNVVLTAPQGISLAENKPRTVRVNLVSRTGSTP